jgi:hypothetical protein
VRGKTDCRSYRLRTRHHDPAEEDAPEVLGLASCDALARKAAALELVGGTRQSQMTAGLRLGRDRLPPRWKGLCPNPRESPDKGILWLSRPPKCEIDLREGWRFQGPRAGAAVVDP